MLEQALEIYSVVLLSGKVRHTRHGSVVGGLRQVLIDLRLIVGEIVAGLLRV